MTVRTIPGVVRTGGPTLLAVLATLTAIAGVVLAGLAAYVGWKRGTRAGLSLAFLLLAVSWWGLAYVLELSTTDLGLRGRWGDLKYVGICGVAPAWFAFALQYTGRSHLVTRRVVALLLAEPLVVIVLLALPATHDLVRFYPRSELGQALPVVEAGPVFWFHLAYANATIFVGTVVFVRSMVRLARTYRRMALLLLAAALLPWAANLAFNFGVGILTRLDLTPFAFTVTGGVLVWGVFRERLIDLVPIARGAVLDGLPDGVFVLDAFGRVTDVNPAGAAALGTTRAALVGHPLAELLPDLESGAAMTLGAGQEARTFDVQRRDLADNIGRQAGRLVVLHDTTERVRADARLQELLAERSRVAAALQTSLVPAYLPEIASLDLGSRYEPAGDGREIGGDFFDVFPLEQDVWGVVMGDVSGKGAEAAAVTALIRYTLRALADPADPPSRTLRQLNTQLVRATPEERFCTLVYAVLRLGESGAVELTVSLAGHHPPLVRRSSGATEPVGRLGTAVGLFDDPELHDARVTLHPGDLVCLFTDGLVEARDDADLFGSERVAAVLARHPDDSADDVAAGLVGAARAFDRGPVLGDDLAVLVLRAVGADVPRRLTLVAEAPGV
jgi:serine phosphatase RsbU (regulator of sigma subunit)